jgi:quinol monooxygenase YgiN
MIIVSGHVDIQADKHDEAAQLTLWMAAETRQEDGCLHYHFYSDLANPNRFFVYEEWRDLAALQAHFHTDHMATFNQQFPALLASQPAIMRHEVSASETL